MEGLGATRHARPGKSASQLRIQTYTEVYIVLCAVPCPLPRAVRPHDDITVRAPPPKPQRSCTSTRSQDSRRREVRRLRAEKRTQSHKAGVLTAYIKGAPERVLAKCSTYLKDGKEVPITDDFRAAYDEAYDVCPLSVFRIRTV